MNWQKESGDLMGTTLRILKQAVEKNNIDKAQKISIIMANLCIFVDTHKNIR